MTDLINNLASQEVFGRISLSTAIDQAMAAGMDYEEASESIIAAGMKIAKDARQ